MQILILLSLICFFLKAQGQNPYQAFSNLNLQVYYKSDNTEEYQFYKQEENALPNQLSPLNPEVIIFPNNAQDVSHILLEAQKVKLRVCPRVGGHSYEGYSACDGGLLLDLRNLNKIEFADGNTNKDIVEVEAGNILGNLYYFLVPQNLTLPMGTCPTVGVGGHALGGGYGFIAREYGLLADRLVNATVVLSNGAIVNANEKENTSLFFALRGGGGGNYGVVTKFSFRTVPVPSTTVGIYQAWNGRSQSKNVLNAFVNKFKSHASDSRYTLRVQMYGETISLTGMAINMDVGTVQNDLYNAFKDVSGNYVSWDNTAHYQSYESSIPKNQGLPASTTLEQLSHRQNPNPNNFGRLTSAVFKSVDTNTINAMADSFYKENSFPSGSSRFLQLDPLGGYFNTVSPTATAFPFRAGTDYIMQAFSFFSNFADYQEENKFIDTIKNATDPCSGGNYVNYIDKMDKISSYYSNNFDTLKSVKYDYDAINLFSFPQEVPDESR